MLIIVKTKVNVNLPNPTVDISPGELSRGLFFLDSMQAINLIIESSNLHFKYLNLESNNVVSFNKADAIKNFGSKLWHVLIELEIKNVKILK